MNLDRNKILIVDDEKALRLGLAHCIRKAGFLPLVAADGKEALRLVGEHRPALVILDVMMHGMSGLEVCALAGTKAQCAYSTSRNSSSAFCACSLFSASSQTALWLPSMTSALTSSPRCAGRQCINRASGLAAFISALVTW